MKALFLAALFLPQIASAINCNSYVDVMLDERGQLKCPGKTYNQQDPKESISCTKYEDLKEKIDTLLFNLKEALKIQKQIIQAANSISSGIYPKEVKNYFSDYKTEAISYKKDIESVFQKLKVKEKCLNNPKFKENAASQLDSLSEEQKESVTCWKGPSSCTEETSIVGALFDITQGMLTQLEQLKKQQPILAALIKNPSKKTTFMTLTNSIIVNQKNVIDYSSL